MSATKKFAVVVGIGRQYRQNLGGNDDARLMSRVLRTYGFDNKNIQLLTDNKATRDKVTSAIEWMKASEDSESTVVFFFSGHGGTATIVLWDTALHITSLRDLLAGLNSHKVLIIIQACYSGSLIDDLEGPNRIVISSATETTWSVHGKHYSLWGHKFLDQGMKQGLADVDGDGMVSLQEAYRYSGLGMMSDMYGEEMIL